MPELLHALQGKDLQFLTQLAALWGLEFDHHDVRGIAQELSHAMNHAELFQEIYDALDEGSRDAVKALIQANGRMPWSLFTRNFGEIRSMGAARRERERPDLNPVNATEILWYRGLISKAFLNLDKEPQEYAYLPEEFLGFLQKPEVPLLVNRLPGRPATTLEKQTERYANDRILDQMTTLLSAIRTGQDLNSLPQHPPVLPIAFLTDLAQACGLLNAQGAINPAQVRTFMEAPRSEALRYLFLRWRDSDFNDLHQLPGLVFEGTWQNQPEETRQFVLSLLDNIPAGTWWSLPAFITFVRGTFPDFQRPAGDYDSWYIRRENSQDYLRGIQSWPEVDGALLQQIICRHMHWLGLTDLGTTEDAEQVSAFRISAWGGALLTGQLPEQLPQESERVVFHQNASVDVPRYTTRAIRYQLARFCSLESEEEHAFHYRILPESLQAAVKSGLKVEQFVSLIQRVAAQPIPPTIFRLLENWKSQGVQAHFAQAVLLTVTSAEILDQILQSRAKKFLVNRLNETTVLVQEKQIKQVMSILAELGYLSTLQPGGLIKIVNGNQKKKNSKPK